MSTQKSLEVGDSVAVVEGEIVVSEGTVKSMENEENGFNVWIREDGSNVVKYWEDEAGENVTLLRKREGRYRPITVSNTAELLVK
jgi:hypothetical protein